MRSLVNWLVRILVAMAAVVMLAAAWVIFYPPELLRVGTGYAAKIICSNVFIAGRDADEVLLEDVQAPGHPLLKLVGSDVDLEGGVVRTAMLGVVAPSYAVHRAGLGCANVDEGEIALVRKQAAPLPDVAAADSSLPWPEGDGMTAGDPRLVDLLADPSLVGPSMRAVVIVQYGRIVGETYGSGFNERTPLLGWSMTKTVTGALVGLMVGEGRLDLGARQLFPEWSGDDRRDIALTDLLAMQSGLRFNESYGDVTDVTRMLYLERNMGGYVASLPAETAPGLRFNYSSGETVLISRYWMSRFESPAEAHAFPRAALFDVIGMGSAVLEADQTGTFVGGSYLYATGRDWARFGLLLAQQGRWAGRQVLDSSFIERINRPTEASGGDYTFGQAWQNGPGDKDSNYDLPAETIWVLGHDGQSIAIVPSEGLVVVRLGLTPRKLDYKPQRLVEAVRQALR